MYAFCLAGKLLYIIIAVDELGAFAPWILDNVQTSLECSQEDSAMPVFFDGIYAVAVYAVTAGILGK